MKRTELKRTPFVRKAPAAESKPPKGPRKRKCQACETPFVPFRSLEAWCSAECGLKVAETRLAKQRAKQQRQERAETKAKLAEYETIPQLKARLQAVFNLYIRLRDDLAGYPCICCGKWPKGDARLTGGQWDACHWKGRGAHDHLRYNEDNVHRGLKDCNKYGHTDYRGGLIKRIGLERVLALEADHTVVKWDRDWLREKISYYQRQVRELKKELKNA